MDRLVNLGLNAALTRLTSASEISFLTEKVEEYPSVLQSKLTNSVTNQRTTAEVREKWKNLHSQAKKEFSGFQRNQKNWRRKGFGGRRNLRDLL